MKKNIVILDGYTLNPGDLNWSELEVLGHCTIYDRTAPDRVVPRAKNAHLLLLNKVVLSREAILGLPQLEYIGVLATGYNVVDTNAARERNIPVTNVPTYGTLSVAQMVFAHLLNLTQHTEEHSRSVRQGGWNESKDFCYWNFPLIELAGKTMGIIGFGRIGRAVADIALAFGMDVLAVETKKIKGMPPGIRQTDLETLFVTSDVVSLHCPLTPQTRHLVDERQLRHMKSSAFLINTSRGPLIDETALAEALNSGRIAGAGLDVLDTEPPIDRHLPLLSAKNCYITPHIAWATLEARRRLLSTVVENVRCFLAGRPQNVVNV
ncbi:D-2-hydroxyacid dehydrogenase [candidate division KSB1 bacterium]|nr:D-2-hydroxyacid dehydrogenase [candidate division KSB1 bacterium]